MVENHNYARIGRGEDENEGNLIMIEDTNNKLVWRFKKLRMEDTNYAPIWMEDTNEAILRI